MVKRICDMCGKEVGKDEYVRFRFTCSKILHTSDWQDLDLCEGCAKKLIPEDVVFEAEAKYQERKKRTEERRAARLAGGRQGNEQG